MPLTMFPFVQKVKGRVENRILERVKYASMAECWCNTFEHFFFLRSMSTKGIERSVRVFS